MIDNLHGFDDEVDFSVPFVVAEFAMRSSETVTLGCRVEPCMTTSGNSLTKEYTTIQCPKTSLNEGRSRGLCRTH